MEKTIDELISVLGSYLIKLKYQTEINPKPNRDYLDYYQKSSSTRKEDTMGYISLCFVTQSDETDSAELADSIIDSFRVRVSQIIDIEELVSAKERVFRQFDMYRCNADTFVSIYNRIDEIFHNQAIKIDNDKNAAIVSLAIKAGSVNRESDKNGSEAETEAIKDTLKLNISDDLVRRLFDIITKEKWIECDLNTFLYATTGKGVAPTDYPYINWKGNKSQLAFVLRLILGVDNLNAVKAVVCVFKSNQPQRGRNACNIVSRDILEKIKSSDTGALTKAAESLNKTLYFDEGHMDKYEECWDIFKGDPILRSRIMEKSKYYQQIRFR